METQLNHTDEPLEEQSVDTTTNQTNDGPSAADPETFYCAHGNHWVSRALALYPHAENPAICKTCAAKQRKHRKEEQQGQQKRKQLVLGGIPNRELRGGQKRATFTLSRYALTALDVLSVGSSASEVTESAIMSYLQGQDADVIAFVGKMFDQLATK